MYMHDILVKMVVTFRNKYCIQEFVSKKILCCPCLWCIIGRMTKYISFKKRGPLSDSISDFLTPSFDDILSLVLQCKYSTLLTWMFTAWLGCSSEQIHDSLLTKSITKQYLVEDEQQHLYSSCLCSSVSVLGYQIFLRKCVDVEMSFLKYWAMNMSDFFDKCSRKQYYSLIWNIHFIFHQSNLCISSSYATDNRLLSYHILLKYAGSNY
jgi:hypothetical protein